MAPPLSSVVRSDAQVTAVSQVNTVTEGNSETRKPAACQQFCDECGGVCFGIACVCVFCICLPVGVSLAKEA